MGSSPRRAASPAPGRRTHSSATRKGASVPGRVMPGSGVRPVGLGAVSRFTGRVVLVLRMDDPTQAGDTPSRRPLVRKLALAGGVLLAAFLLLSLLMPVDEPLQPLPEPSVILLDRHGEP